MAINLEINLRIADILKTLASNETMHFKVQAYLTASEIIRSLTFPVTSGAMAMKIKGIGKSIAAKIDEILATGSLQIISDNEEKMLSMKELGSVHGIGQVTAKAYYDMGYRTVVDLQKAVHSGALSVTKARRLAIVHYFDVIQRIPRAEMVEFETILKEVGLGLEPPVTVQLVGSYRRGKPDSGDIDVLLCPETVDTSISSTQSWNNSRPFRETPLIPKLIEQFKQRLIEKGLWIGSLSRAATGSKHPGIKIMGMIRLPVESAIVRRIDLLMVPVSSFPFALLYFTGSKEFNVRMRTFAMLKGYRLNEFDLIRDVGTDKETAITHLSKSGLPILTEKDVFAELEYAYVPPINR